MESSGFISWPSHLQKPGKGPVFPSLDLVYGYTYMMWVMIMDREKSLNAIRSIEFFGTGATPQQVEQLQALESEAHDVMLILLSDVHLDRPSVMDKLKVPPTLGENDRWPGWLTLSINSLLWIGSIPWLRWAGRSQVYLRIDGQLHRQARHA